MDGIIVLLVVGLVSISTSFLIPGVNDEPSANTGKKRRAKKRWPFAKKFLFIVGVIFLLPIALPLWFLSQFVSFGGGSAKARGSRREKFTEPDSNFYADGTMKMPGFRKDGRPKETGKRPSSPSIYNPSTGLREPLYPKTRK